MSFSQSIPVLGRLAGAALLGSVLSACSMGGLLGGGNSDAQLANTTASASQIAEAAPTALPAIATECPPIRIRPGADALFSYANNRLGDAQSLRFQAVIDQVSRNCVVSNGLITVRMGAVGRFLLGPAQNVSSYTLPLRFAVEREGVAVFSQKYDIPVTVTPPNQSEEFIKVVENVAIPYLGGETITIWVGFDT